MLYSDESAESRSRTVSGWLQLASLAAVYSALCACRVLQTSMAYIPYIFIPGLVVNNNTVAMGGLIRLIV